jgi:hypothetical protein
MRIYTLIQRDDHGLDALSYTNLEALQDENGTLPEHAIERIETQGRWESGLLPDGYTIIAQDMPHIAPARLVGTEMAVAER